MSRARTPEAATCPGCGKPATPGEHPFCSAGCRNRDLLKWLSDEVRLPGPAADPDELSHPAGLDSQATPRL